MQFLREGSLFKVVRITGPTHNILCAEIMIGSEPIEQIESLQIPTGAMVQLHPDAVLREIKMGFEEAGQHLGVCVTAKRLQFMPSDSPPPEVYRVMARALVDHFAAELPRQPIQ
jgi:hypothetical protein